MTRAKDISKIVTDADLSGTLDIAGTVTAGGLTVNGTADVDGVVTVDRVINATTSSDPWLKGVNGSNTETFFLKPSGQAYFGGNVGIGTSSPASDGKLTIHGTDTDSGILLSRSSGNDVAIHNIGGTLAFRTGGESTTLGGLAERMRINSNGNVRIGTEDEVNLTVQSLFVQGSKVNFASVPGLAQNQLLVYDDTASTSGSGGAISFGANTGSSQRTWIAEIEAGRDSSSNDSSNYAGSLRFYTRPAQSIPAERMRITSAGNVGIGDSSPQRKLMVNGIAKFRNTITLGGSNSSTDYNAYFANEAYANNASDSTVTLGTHSTRPLIFATNTTERMRITDGGKVGIGTTSPVANLEIKKLVSTTGSMTDTALHLTTDGTTGRKLNIGFGLGGGVANTNAAVIGFDVADGSGATQGDLFFSTRSGTSDSVPTERMRITSTGRPIFYQTTSSLTHRYATTNYESMYVSRFAMNMQGNQSYTITFNGFTNGMYHFNCFAAHWNSTYTLYRNSYMGLQSSAVFSEYNLHDRSSAAQGAFSFTNPSNAKIAVVKSAGTYIGGMNAIIEIKGPALLNIDSVA